MAAFANTILRAGCGAAIAELNRDATKAVKRAVANAKVNTLVCRPFVLSSCDAIGAIQYSSNEFPKPQKRVPKRGEFSRALAESTTAPTHPYKIEETRLGPGAMDADMPVYIKRRDRNLYVVVNGRAGAKYDAPTDARLSRKGRSS